MKVWSCQKICLFILLLLTSAPFCLTRWRNILSVNCILIFLESTQFDSQVEQHWELGGWTEGDEQRPGLNGCSVEAWASRFGCGQRSLSVGVRRHEDALQQRQGLAQILQQIWGEEELATRRAEISVTHCNVIVELKVFKDSKNKDRIWTYLSI